MPPLGPQPKDKGYDAETHVLVLPGESGDSDLDAGFLGDLAPQSFVDRLVQFQHASGWLPLAVVTTLHD